VLQPLTFTLEYHPSNIKWKWKQKPLGDGHLLLVVYVLCLFEMLMKAEDVLTQCRWCDSGCSAWCSVMPATQ